MSEKTSQENTNRILWAEFLEQIPPGTTAEIEDLLRTRGTSWPAIATPDIHLYCTSDVCSGMRFFAYKGSEQAITNEARPVFLNYRCRNCSKTSKLFAVYVHPPIENEQHALAIKLGELPAFGPPVPARVVSLIGPDREIFLRGRRAENQGLGIGAFAYYRRVVENQQGRLISEIAKVARRLGATPDVLEKFERAAKETQFSKAVDDVKDVIPQALLIDGHNPLKLLHSALSEGIHDLSDEECLELATSIRVVLTELSERILQALKDEQELKHAVARLLKPTSKQT